MPSPTLSSVRGIHQNSATFENTMPPHRSHTRQRRRQNHHSRRRHYSPLRLRPGAYSDASYSVAYRSPPQSPPDSLSGGSPFSGIERVGTPQWRAADLDFNGREASPRGRGAPYFGRGDGRDGDYVFREGRILIVKQRMATGSGLPADRDGTNRGLPWLSICEEGSGRVLLSAHGELGEDVEVKDTSGEVVMVATRGYTGGEGSWDEIRLDDLNGGMVVDARLSEKPRRALALSGRTGRGRSRSRVRSRSRSRGRSRSRSRGRSRSLSGGRSVSLGGVGSFVGSEDWMDVRGAGRGMFGHGRGGRGMMWADDLGGFGRNGYRSHGSGGLRAGRRGRRGYGLGAYGMEGHGIRGYGMNGYGVNGYGLEGYGMEGYGMDEYGMDGYAMGGYGMDGYGMDGYGMTGYGMNGFGGIGVNEYGMNGNGTESYGMDGYGMGSRWRGRDRSRSRSMGRLRERSLSRDRRFGRERSISRGRRSATPRYLNRTRSLSQGRTNYGLGDEGFDGLGTGGLGEREYRDDTGTGMRRGYPEQHDSASEMRMRSGVPDERMEERLWRQGQQISAMNFGNYTNGRRQFTSDGRIDPDYFQRLRYFNSPFLNNPYSDMLTASVMGRGTNGQGVASVARGIGLGEDLGEDGERIMEYFGGKGGEFWLVRSSDFMRENFEGQDGLLASISYYSVGGGGAGEACYQMFLQGGIDLVMIMGAIVSRLWIAKVTDGVRGRPTYPGDV